MNRILLSLFSTVVLLFSSSSFATNIGALDDATNAQWRMANVHVYVHTAQRYAPGSSGYRNNAYWAYQQAVIARNDAYSAWLESPGGAGETYAYRAYQSLASAAYYAYRVYLYGNSYLSATINNAAAGDRHLSLAAWYNGLQAYNE